MDLKLQGKTALVTGSTAGIGLATAAALVREGAAVAINGRTRERVQEAASRIGGSARGLVADLAGAEGAAAIVAALPDVDILVNNVGIYADKPFTAIDDDEWLRPGPTRSEGVAQFVEGLAKSRGVSAAEVEREFFREMRPTSLLRRFETPEEVASLVTYLASPLASGTTGAALRVDGGVVRAIV